MNTLSSRLTPIWILDSDYKADKIVCECHDGIVVNQYKESEVTR
jgi:hypothetical protein